MKKSCLLGILLGMIMTLCLSWVLFGDSFVSASGGEETRLTDRFRDIIIEYREATDDSDGGKPAESPDGKPSESPGGLESTAVTTGGAYIPGDDDTGDAYARFPYVTEFPGAPDIVVIPAETGYKYPRITEFGQVIEIPVGSDGKSGEPSGGEIRAAWIPTVYNLDFESAAGKSADEIRSYIDGIVDRVSAHGLNAVFFQVRPCSDAFYKSGIFPSSHFLTGAQGSEIAVDPLEYMIISAHRKNIAVHAWINPYRVTTASMSRAELSSDNPASEHPEWTYEAGGCVYYDPSLRQVRNLIANGVAEIVRGYDVDGIIFDDYFYPEDIGDADAFQYAAGGGGLSLGDFRRNNVNMLVELCYNTVKSIDGGCLFGVSPRGIWRNSSSDPSGSATNGGEAYDSISCDALAWMKGGYVDYISPQIYWSRENRAAPFTVLAEWWSEAAAATDTRLVVSLASYYLPDFEISAQKTILSTVGCGEWALYSLKSLD